MILTVLLLTGCEFVVTEYDEENIYLTYKQIEIGDNNTIYIACVDPEDYEVNKGIKSYPVLLTFSSGYQTINNVQSQLDKYWITESIKRNWVVISPIAPDTTNLFFRGSEDLIPGLLDWVEDNYNVEGNKFHIAGTSNGGLSAFRIAIQNNERVQSLTVFPGYPPIQEDFWNLDSLYNIPITMYVGALDTTFYERMDPVADELIYLGFGDKLEYHKLPYEDHIIDGLKADQLFDLLDTHRPSD